MKRFMLCLMIFLFLFPVKGICETKEIIAVGEYTMGDGETPEVAGEKARKEAIRAAAEEAGAFVKSYSKVQNLILAEDIVEVVADHAMKITVLDKKRSMVGNLEAIRFQVKIKAVMTTEDVAANLKKVREDRGVVDAYNRLKADYDRQSRDMETLKKRLTEAGGEEKKQVLAEITNEEKRFKANLWLEKAAELLYRNDEMGLKAYDKAIELNPALVEAYIGRAKLVRGRDTAECTMLLNKGASECTGQQENLNKALADLNQAISLDQGRAEAYIEMADVYNLIRNIEWLIANSRKESIEAIHEIKTKYASLIFAAINRAISLKPDNPEYYRKRADYFNDLRDDSDNAISDMSRAIVLCRETDCFSLPSYYEKRAELHRDAGKIELWKKDEAEAKKIYAAGQKASEEKGAKEELAMQVLLKSEYAKLRQKLYAGNSMHMNEQEAEQTLKALDRKIAQKKGKAEDYILRADLGRSRENRLRDYSEAIRLLKSGRPEGENALLLVRVYFFKSMVYDKQLDSALKELQEAKKVLDLHLPHAIDLLKGDNYKAMMTSSDEEGMNKIMKMTRSEAEAFSWTEFADKIMNARAAIYEELGLPGKAKAEYQYLCEKLKDAGACKNVERLQ